MTSRPVPAPLANTGKALAIAGVSLRRLFRERSNIFFVIISPLLFVFVLGLLFGGGQSPRLGVVGADAGPLAERLAGALAGAGEVELTRYDSVAELRDDVESGLVNGGLVIPPEYDTRLPEGGQVSVEWLARTADPNAPSLLTWARSVVSQQAAVLRAAQFGQSEGAGSFDQTLAAAGSADLPGVAVSVTTTGEALFPEGLNQFTPIAPSQLLLFVFLTSLAASLGLIQTRGLGITGRMLATPTPVTTIVVGEALGRLGIAVVQGLIVLLGSALLFGVDWGDPVGAGAVLLLFCAVGSGAAMVVGSVFSSEGPALGAAMGLGLGLAAVGGAMVPLELFGDTAQVAARFTPHAWGYLAYAELIRHDAGITDILPHLGVLAGFAAVLFSLGVWRLRRSLTG